VIRTRAGEVKLSGRQTMGVRLMNLEPGDSVVAIARNAESLDADADDAPGDAAAAPEGPADADGAPNETPGADV
jgi:DNA gyrase subunit A